MLCIIVWVLIQSIPSVASNDEDSIIDQIDGGQITLELYLFGPSMNHSSLMWVDDNIALTPKLHHLPSRSNVKRSRRDDKSYLLHPCTITHCHGQDVLVTCEPYNRLRESSTRQPRAPSCHATSGHLTYGEKFLTMMQLNMVAACDPRIT